MPCRQQPRGLDDLGWPNGRGKRGARPLSGALCWTTAAPVPAKHHSGNDSELPRDAFDVTALHAKIQRHQSRLRAFTSKNAAPAVLGRPVDHGLQAETFGRTRLFVLLSPSG